MKKLHLIRHAKSSWRDASIADIERPLNKRGVKSAGVMAAQIVKAGCGFERVFCSPAVRAQSTIEQLCQQLPKREITWEIEDALYTFEMESLLRWCQALDDAIADVVIVGHNSALTDLINFVGDHPIENLPTCGYVQLALSVNAWKDLAAESAQLLSFLKPKMFM